MAIVLALAFLPHAIGYSAGHAATLSAERESVVRRETNRVQINAHGDVIQHLRPKENLFGNQYCDTDYPIGIEKTSNCTNANPTDKEEIMDKEGTDAMCLQAATESGAKAISGRFVIGTFGDWQQLRPRGCFKQACHESDNGVCYFFNPVTGWPDHTAEGFEGTPVCKRPKTANGTKNVAGGCPTGYQMIDDEETCRSAANCRGYPHADEFRIGTNNASKHSDWVRGCFFDEDDSFKVYFNRKTNMPDCTTCKGTQMCMVSTTTSWKGADKLHPGAAVAAVPHTPEETETEREEDTDGTKGAEGKEAKDAAAEKAAGEKAAAEKAATEKAAAEKAAAEKAAAEKAGAKEAEGKEAEEAAAKKAAEEKAAAEKAAAEKAATPAPAPPGF